MPHGLGRDPHRLRGEIETAKAKVAAAWKDAAPVAAPGAPKGNTNASNNPERIRVEGKRYGTDPEYLAGRIKAKAATGDERAAAVAERLEAGTYDSMRAAARDAGVLKPVDPVRAALRAMSRLTPEQRAEVLRLLEAAS